MTTAEQAARGVTTRKGYRDTAMLAAIAELRRDPVVAPYLDTAEIVVALAEGRFGPQGLALRVAQMADADVGE